MASRGQPSKYKKKYCKQVVEHLSSGFSFESFGAVIDVHRDSLYEWRKVHPEFSDAIKTGQLKALHRHEQVGKAIMYGVPISAGKTMLDPKKMNTAIWIFKAKTQYGFIEKSVVEHTGNITSIPSSEQVKTLCDELEGLAKEKDAWKE